jgi:hypothetical protein
MIWTGHAARRLRMEKCMHDFYGKARREETSRKIQI